jgi:hypothetical protein
MPATYEPIATTTTTSASTSIEFASISGNYTDLVLVLNIKAVSTTTNQWVNLRLNGDAASNYSQTTMSASGSARSSFRYSSRSDGIFIGDTNSNDYALIICNIQNYSNTTTHKTVLSRSTDASDFLKTIVGLWRKTPEAITTINLQIESSANNIASGTTATLYGIKAA